MNPNLNYKIKKYLSNPYNLILASFIIFLAFALIANTPKEIIHGMGKILSTEDVLISDYILIGNIGAALFNSALVGAFSILIIKLAKCSPKGGNIAAVLTMCGFALFGKSILNILPIVAGGLIYCWYRKIAVKDNIAGILLATALSPAVSKMLHLGLESRLLGIVLGCAVGLLIGFMTIPISLQTKRVHEAFDMYNVGFVAGIIGLVIAAILRNLGFETPTLSLWSEGNNIFMIVFLICINLFFIIVGAYCHGEKKDYFKPRLFVRNDTRSADYFEIYGVKSYINMGIVGLVSTVFVLVINGEFSGPTVGAILTVMGFSFGGKNLLNVTPIVLGGIIATYVSGNQINAPGIILGFLFSTTLAPIANNYGFLWGTIAGFLHIHTVVNLASIQGGLNLYNNGFAAGFVATLLIPIIFAIRRSPKYPKFLNKINNSFEKIKSKIEAQELDS